MGYAIPPDQHPERATIENAIWQDWWARCTARLAAADVSALSCDFVLPRQFPTKESLYAA